MTASNPQCRGLESDFSRQIQRHAKGSKRCIFARSGNSKSPIDIYFTSFKMFFYFYSYPKHNNMIKNCSQTMGLLQVISAHSGTSGHRAYRAVGSGRSRTPPPDSTTSSPVTSYGSGLPGLVRQCPETPVSSQTRRACEKVGEGRKGSSWSYIIEHSAACPKNVL